MKDRDIANFARKLAHLHNQEIHEGFPRMFSEFSGRKESSPAEYSTWTLLYEASVETHEEPCKPDVFSAIQNPSVVA